MNLMKSASRFLKKNGGTILAIGASVGVVLTAIETGKASIKAEKLIEMNSAEPAYTMKEKVQDCWKFYLPAAALGAGTIACILGSNALNKKQIASLTAGYMALGKAYQEYRREVAEHVGAEHEKEIYKDARSVLKEPTSDMVEDKLTKDITTTYIKTGMKLAKVYAPAIGLGAASLGCMFGSHHIMTKRNATLTAAYIALEQSFNGYKNRVADRFGERVQHELEQNVKAVEVETKKVDENGVEEVIKEYKDIAEQADDPCTLIFDETVDTWERDADLNRNYLLLMESAANKKLRSQGHLFLNEVLTMIGTHGGQSLRTPTGQVVGWVYNPNDTSLHNHVDFGLTSFESSDEALKSFLRGEERSVILHFNCDGIKDGLLAIMHDRLYQMSTFFLKEGYINTAALKNLEYLYNSYHALGGNGTGTELYTRAKGLPIKED